MHRTLQEILTNIDKQKRLEIKAKEIKTLFLKHKNTQNEFQLITCVPWFALENQSLEDEFPFGKPYFRGLC